MGLAARGGQLGSVGRAAFCWHGGSSWPVSPQLKGQLGGVAQKLAHHSSSAVEELRLASAA